MTLSFKNVILQNRKHFDFNGKNLVPIQYQPNKGKLLYFLITKTYKKELEAMIANSVYLDIFPEKSCNRGCKHCGFDSSMNGPRHSLSVSDVNQLVDEIKKMKNNFFINITGGGEPLLNEELPRIIELLLNADNIVHIDLATSGTLPSDQNEINRLEEILAMNQSQKLDVRISFNEYNNTCKERFISTLMLLINSPYVSKIKVASRFSLQRIISTHEKLLGCLNKVVKMLGDETRITEGLLHPGYEYYRSVADSDFFSRHKWNKYMHSFVTVQTFLMEIPYYLKISGFPSKEIVVEPIFLHLVGRARCLKESPIMTMKLVKKTPPEKNVPRLVVDYDGYFYPSYMCFYRDHLGIESICISGKSCSTQAITKHSELMRLGRVGNCSLGEAIKMKALLREHAPENFIGVPSLIRHECQICLEQKLKLFG